MKQIALINIVGLSKRLLGDHTPFLTEWIKVRNIINVEPVLPAVTCSVQTTYLTGKWPNEHGIVGNGWKFRNEQEVKLWRQSNLLVQAPSLWDNAKNINPNFTCANMFWWYNMNSSVDFGVTPRPQYLADGRKMPDCYSKPADLRDQLQNELGTFPLFDFWGPKTSIKSSQWIANASKKVFQEKSPTCLLVYLPHLDYGLQKYGYQDQRIYKNLNEIDEVCADLIEFLESHGVEVLLTSEYGITPVEKPIHINRLLREMKLLSVRVERGTELPDIGLSKAFALADHQLAHIYCNDPAVIPQVKARLQVTQGIEMVLDKQEQAAYHLDHERSGELVAVADKKSWFTYYHWLNDNKAPDYARTVAIHNKPGYDPVEMFLDPNKILIKPRILLKLIKKKLGFRMLMDIIPLDARLVKGSHGRCFVDDDDKAILAGNNLPQKNLAPTAMHDLLLTKIFPENS